MLTAYTQMLTGSMRGGLYLGGNWKSNLVSISGGVATLGGEGLDPVRKG